MTVSLRIVSLWTSATYTRRRERFICIQRLEEVHNRLEIWYDLLRRLIVLEATGFECAYARSVRGPLFSLKSNSIPL